MVKKKISLKQLLEYLIPLFLILETNSILFKLKKVKLPISGVASFLIVILFLTSHVAIKKQDVKYVICYEIYAIVYALMSVREDNIISFGVKFLVVIPILILTYRDNVDTAINIIKKYSDIMVFLSITSLVMYFFSYFLPHLGIVNIEWGSVDSAKNYIFFFDVQRQAIFGQHILRNTGIFVEAPMYGFCLSLALSTKLFFYRDLELKKVIILCATIITTISVTAVLLMTAMLVLKYYYGDVIGNQGTGNSVYYKRRNRSMRYVVTFIGIIIVATVFYYLLNFKLNTGLSFSKRLDDYASSIKAWRQRPIWGIGYGNGDQIVNYMVEWRIKYSTTGFSNSVMIILSTMGIYGSGIYVVGFLKGIINNFNDRKYISLQLIILFVLLFVTVVPMQLIVLNYVALGISSPNIKSTHRKALHIKSNNWWK